MRRAQGVVEYGLILGLICVVALAAYKWSRNGGCHFRGHLGKCDIQTLDDRVKALEARLPPASPAPPPPGR